MRTIKRVGIKSQLFKPKEKQTLILDLIKNNQGDAYMRKGNFSSEIIWEGKSYVFPPKGKHKVYNKGMFLFGLVRRDAKAFVKSGKKIVIPNKYPTNEYNESFDKFGEKITGTDLNHAYWRIALNLGIITKSTYLKGLVDEFKTLRLAALSTLGKGKEYFVIKGGVVTDEVVKIGFDENMDALYKAIRYTCFKYMQVVKKLLEDDFVCYKTDCVYYVDTPENRKKVRDYFKGEEMTYKQMGSIKKTLHEQGSFQ